MSVREPPQPYGLKEYEEMFQGLMKASDSLRCLKLAAFSMGLSTKMPLDKATILAGLGAIQVQFPVLSDVTYDDKEDIVRLRNGEVGYEREILLRVSKSSGLDLAWGAQARFGSKEDARKLFDTIQEGFALAPVNVDLMDFQAHFRSDWSGQHYHAIWNAYFKETCFGALFRPEDILQDDIRLRALLNEDRIVVININSDVTDTEVRRRVFEGDSLRASMGIAYRCSLKSNAKLSDVFQKHVDSSMGYIEKKFLESVVMPLDQALALLEGARTDES
jgi:hypothetical protein